MNTTRFIIKTATKIIMFAIISMIALTLLTSPVITNELALTQMENSNELYLLMETCNKIRPFISITYNCITVWFAVTIISDTYKFIETKTKENN